MKHLLNDLSDEEKNRIREQHSGGKKIVIENFNKLINTKLGDAKPYLNEEEMTGAPQKITAKEGGNYTYSIANISNLKEKPKGLTFEKLQELVIKNRNSIIVINIPGETRGWRASLVGKDELVLNMITD